MPPRPITAVPSSLDLYEKIPRRKNGESIGKKSDRIDNVREI
jgi:hypothetical protein